MINDGVQRTDFDIDAFLMIGQSNMAGRGELDGTPGITNPKCLMQRNGRWQPMSEPINPDRGIFAGEYRSGACLAASFADLYARRHGVKVGLIPCADGGTSIDLWQPGCELYEHAVFCAKIAMRTSSLKAILFHQGESNCHGMSIEVYTKRLISLIEGMRCDLELPDIPFIAGELSEHIDESKWRVRVADTVRYNENFHSLVGVIPHYAVAEAKELPLKPDGIHFNTTSLRELGRRYFDIYEKNFAR